LRLRKRWPKRRTFPSNTNFCPVVKVIHNGANLTSRALDRWVGHRQRHLRLACVRPLRGSLPISSHLHSIRIMNETLNRRSYTFGSIGVAVTAPSEIVRILDVTMCHVLRRESVCDIELFVTHDPGAWIIADDLGQTLKLRADTALPEVSGALSTIMAERIAQKSAMYLMSAVIISKARTAVALMGQDWASCVAVAIHLSLRGWAIMAPRYAFIDPVTHEVEPLSKLLYIPSRIIPSLPVPYRRALEASPWYSRGNELGFYGVDPLSVHSVEQSSEKPTLRGCLTVDGAAESEIGSERPLPCLPNLPFPHLGIASASLRIGAIVPTTDIVETWADMRRSALNG
jgi:hypothetical protein